MNEKRFLTSNEPVRFIEVEPEPMKRGPMTSDSALTPAKNYVVKNAIDSEWASFQKVVEARIAKEPREVFEICDRCGFVISRPFRARRGGACLTCNFAGIEGGGMMREMEPGEIKAYLAAKQKRGAEGLERMRLAAWNADCENRKKAGLPPWTREEFDARRKAEFEKRRAEDRAMMDLARKLAKDLPR